MVRWVRDKVQPPTAPDIEIAVFGPPVVVARDSFGNALGDIRLSQHAVPTATNTGLNSGQGWCQLYGSFQPFDAAVLDVLYPSHGNYVSQVSQTTFDNLQIGFIVMEDAEVTVRDAAHFGIGKH